MMPANKIPLKFREDGNFRILMVSDIQEIPDYDKRTPEGLRALIRATNPDLMIWGGDNCDGRKIFTEDQFRAYLEVFTAPMEEAGIPWMHVYGNHDHDCGVDALRQSEIYAEYPHCISGISPEGVPGVCNYTVTVTDPATGKPGFCIYAFDTHHKNPKFRPGVKTGSLLVPNRPDYIRKWDIIRFEQLMWYWNTSRELEHECDGKVRAMAVMHVAPHEFQIAVDNPEQSNLLGCHDEVMQMGVLNSGAFATMLQRGDVEIIAAGHSHEDSVDAIFGGIRLCMDGCAGFSPYGREECRGGRVFDINLDGTHSTHMVTYKELMDI